MRIFILLATFALPSAFASHLVTSSSSDGALFLAPRINGLERARSFLSNFCPRKDVGRALSMLEYPKFPYQETYDDIGEKLDRQIQLFNGLYSTTGSFNYHKTFFNPRKLQKNLILATKIFLDTTPVVYKGQFFALGLQFRFDHVYTRSKGLAMAMLLLVIKEQMGMARDLIWLDHFLGVAEVGDVHKIFGLFFEFHEMTPKILETFMNYWNGTGQYSLVNYYLYPYSTMPHEELLLRCALLSSVRQMHMYTECKGFEPYNNLKELGELAVRIGDRQSISIIFESKFEYQDGLEVSELAEYVKFGGLSPMMTRDFIRSAFYTDAKIDGWPLEHLQIQLPSAVLPVPKEERLSEWLRSDALAYESMTCNGLDDLYNTGTVASVNMKFIEPVQMKDGRIVSWAADYFILDAQAILNAYRNNQRTIKRIPDRDYRKITTGILYALAEGQHLDFSNTGLEMREGDKEWGWFERFAKHHNQGRAAKVALRFLKSEEIYGYVQGDLTLQFVQDEQIRESTVNKVDLCTFFDW